MRKLALISVFLFSAMISISQSMAKKDSLLRQISIAKDDTSKVLLLLQINSVYNNEGKSDSSIFYLNKAQNLANEKGFSGFFPRINTAFIQYYYTNNDYNKSKEYALKNIAIAEKNKDEVLLAKAYNNITAVYTHFGNNKQAIDYALKCLALSEKIKDSADFPARYATVSNTYLNLNQYDKVVFYAKKAIELAPRFHEDEALWAGLNNLGGAYSGKHKLDSAIYFGIKQLKFAQKEEYTEGVIYSLNNLCYKYFLNGDLPGVENSLKELQKNEALVTDKSIIAEIFIAKSLPRLLKKEFSLAKTMLDSSIALATHVSADRALGNAYNTYAKMYFMQNKVKEAEDYAYKYDSLQSAANIKELNFYIEDLGVQYETEKKEDQLKLQQVEIRQKSNLIYFLIAGVAAIIIISLLTYRNHKNKQKLQQAKIDELETEKQLTATEAVLKGEEQERTRLAKDLHDGLGGMLSGIKFSLSNMKENLIMTPDNAQAFERSIDMLDSSIKEMRRVAHSMMPEVLMKYGLDTAVKEFCNEIDRSGVLHVNYQAIGMANANPEQTTSVTVYRIIQELVNNAIKHSAAKSVLVQLHFAEQEKQLAITVEDDGKGFDKESLSKSTARPDDPVGRGIGWSNIQNRVEFLKGKIDVNSVIDKGTSVLIEINI